MVPIGSAEWCQDVSTYSLRLNACIVGGGAGDRSPATVIPVTTSSLYRATFPKRILPL